jgi:ribosomal protein S18 acetylase RimI-like enzyme
VTVTFTVRPVSEADRDWVLEVVRGWGADFVITRGRKVYPAEIDAFLAVDASGRRLGLVTYELSGDECEIVTLDALERFRGIGTALVEAVKEDGRVRGCRRLWLITTNDNLEAIRFYQRRGFTLAAVHANALEVSRRLKPSIPRVGQYGIPLRDEIELEMFLAGSTKA